MKTTIEVADALLEDAKKVAARDGTSLRTLVEAGLRRELHERHEVKPFKLRDASVTGHGMRAEFAEGGWERVRDAIYEGHGA